MGDPRLLRRPPRRRVPRRRRQPLQDVQQHLLPRDRARVVRYRRRAAAAVRGRLHASSGRGRGSVPFFVSDESNQQAKLYVQSRNPFVTSADKAFNCPLRQGRPRSLTAPTITLDDLLASEHVTALDFVTMDIELWEPKALAGFDLERFQPALVCVEAHPEVRQQILDYFARPLHRRRQVPARGRRRTSTSCRSPGCRADAHAVGVRSGKQAGSHARPHRYRPLIAADGDEGRARVESTDSGALRPTSAARPRAIRRQPDVLGFQHQYPAQRRSGRRTRQRGSTR